MKETKVKWHVRTPLSEPLAAQGPGHSIRRQRRGAEPTTAAHKPQVRAAEGTPLGLTATNRSSSWTSFLPSKPGERSCSSRHSGGHQRALPSGGCVPVPGPRSHTSPVTECQARAPLNPHHRLVGTHLTPLRTEVTGYKLRSHAEGSRAWGVAAEREPWPDSTGNARGPDQFRRGSAIPGRGLEPPSRGRGLGARPPRPVAPAQLPTHPAAGALASPRTAPAPPRRPHLAAPHECERRAAAPSNAPVLRPSALPPSSNLTALDPRCGI